MTRLSTLAMAAWFAATVHPLPVQADAIVLDLPGITLREALAGILDESGVAIEWPDTATADQLVKGQYEGSIHEVTVDLLSRTDFVIVGDGEGGIVRIVVLGQKLTQSEANAQTVRVQSKKPNVPVKLTAEQRRRQARDLKKLQATNEARRRYMASSPPGWRLLPSQAIMPAFHPGNIPILPLPRRQGR